MRKIETLLELWEYKCEMCSAEKSENSDNETPSIKLMDLIRTRADATKFDYVEHIRSAEEFSTQILCKLLNDIKAFQLEFLQQIGLFAECNKENFNKLVVEAEHSVGKSEKYDLSFWKEKKEPEEKELVCIVEVKIDADFQPNQLGRYYDNLPKCEFGEKESGLATLTKYCVQHHQQVKEAKGYSGIKFNTLLWCDIIDLLEKYQNTSLVQQAIELFKSDYFLLHESGCACDYQEKSVKTEFFIDRISNIFPDSIIHQGSKLKHRHIVLLPPEIEKKTDWCGGFMALSLWFECYAVTGRDIVDTEAPSQVKNNAVPFFDVVLRCYYTIDGKTSAEYDEKVKSLETAGYIRCKVFADDQQKKIKHEYLRKSLAIYLRISDKETLEKEINNTDSEFWTFLTDEISAWQKIVCNN